MSDDVAGTGAAQGDTNAGDGTGAAQGTWFDSLPEDMRGMESVQAFKDKQPADVLKAHLDLQEKVGKAIFVPAEDAKPEEKQAFEASMRKLMGVPENPDGYQINLPEGVPKEDPVMQAFVKASHANGLNTPQLQNVMNDVVKAIHEHREAQKLVNKEAIEKQWGDKFTENVAVAIKGMESAAAEAGLSEEEKQMLARELPSYPMLVKLFHVMGRFYSEDSVGRGSSGGSGQMPRTAGGTPQLDFPSMRKNP